MLMGRVSKRVKDKRLLRLIRAFLNAGVMEGGLVGPPEEGVPQGGPLSPLLSNLIGLSLHERPEAEAVHRTAGAQAVQEASSGVEPTEP